MPVSALLADPPRNDSHRRRKTGRKNGLLYRLLLSLALLLPGQHALGRSAPLEGRVLSVADGDTLTLVDAKRQRHRIRLAAIDAPELGQAYGQQSRLALARLCQGRHASVQISGTDQHQRTLGVVFCGGRDANAELVRQGLAWVYVQYAEPNSPLHALEQEARRTRRGLWIDPKPRPPWEWRRAQNAGPAKTRPLLQSRSSAPVRGNRNSQIYHLPECPSYSAVSANNRIEFRTEHQARQAGYRKAKNCP